MCRRHSAGIREQLGSGRGAMLERTRQEILDGARPLAPEDQSLIEQLSADEARLFLDAVLDT